MASPPTRDASELFLHLTFNIMCMADLDMMCRKAAMLVSGLVTQEGE